MLRNVASCLGFRTCFGSCRSNAIFGVLYPSKSGQIKKHTLKHTSGALCPSKSGLARKHIVSVLTISTGISHTVRLDIDVLPTPVLVLHHARNQVPISSEMKLIILAVSVRTNKQTHRETYRRVRALLIMYGCGIARLD
jgi:hypothetical protein